MGSMRLGSSEDCVNIGAKVSSRGVAVVNCILYIFLMVSWGSSAQHAVIPLPVNATTPKATLRTSVTSTIQSEGG